jgi:hypothetical protein
MKVAHLMLLPIGNGLEHGEHQALEIRNRHVFFYCACSRGLRASRSDSLNHKKKM